MQITDMIKLEIKAKDFFTKLKVQKLAHRIFLIKILQIFEKSRDLKYKIDFLTLSNLAF